MPSIFDTFQLNARQEHAVFIITPPTLRMPNVFQSES